MYEGEKNWKPIIGYLTFISVIVISKIKDRLIGYLVKVHNAKQNEKCEFSDYREAMRETVKIEKAEHTIRE